MSNLTYVNSTTSTLATYRELIDDVSKGSVGIQEAGVKYLPKEDNEKDASYKSRLSKATYFDSFNTTIDGLNGLIFKNPIKYSDDMPNEVQNTIENADRQGNHFDILLERLFDKALRKGISFCMVDKPSAVVESKADEVAQGIRPYYTIIEPENVTSWKSEIINGQLVLTQVKIHETVEIDDPNNPYATKTVERYRILEIGTFEVYQIDSGVETLIADGYTELDFIPLFALNINARGFFDAFPPFYDLGKLNIAHYQIFADSRYSAHVASVPFYVGTGISKEDVTDLVIAPNTFFATHNEMAKIGIVDYDGKGVAVNATLLERIETKMREMGLSVISMDKTVTATEVNISGAQSQSKLNGYVRGLIDTAENILRGCAEMYGKDYGGSVEIDADILSQPLSAQDITALNNMVMSGTISLATMWSMIQSGNMQLPADFDAEAEKENISSDGLLTSDEPGT